MPQIILTNHPHDIGWIRSVMLFPNDEALRNQNYAIEVAKYEVDNIDCLTEKWILSKSKESDIPISAECIKLIIEAPADSVLKTIRANRTKQGIVAGQVLASLYLMDKFGLEEPSLNKAVYVSKEFAKKIKYGDGFSMFSETRIKEFWKEYMPVAHFWAALVINRFYSFVPDQLDCFSEGFSQFLRVAADIYNFGINFIPKRAKPKKPFLDTEKCWVLDSCITPLTLTSNTAPANLIKILKKYKAPKPLSSLGSGTS
jgi:hypothetical protein